MSEQWYYQKEGERSGPVTVGAVRAMLARGDLTPDTAVWCDGMQEWQPVRRVAEFTAEDVVAGRLPAPQGLSGWMMFLGVITIVSGALAVLSCFGIPTGVLTIIAGASLIGARTALDGLGQVPAEMMPFLQKIKTFVVMQSIVFIVGIVLTALIFIFYFSVIMAALGSAQSNW